MNLNINQSILFYVFLKEADNWTTLTSDLEALIEVKDIEKITNRIQGLQQSLVIITKKKQ